jgi:hypothetical protein
MPNTQPLSYYVRRIEWTAVLVLGAFILSAAAGFAGNISVNAFTGVGGNSNDRVRHQQNGYHQKGQGTQDIANATLDGSQEGGTETGNPVNTAGIFGSNNTAYAGGSGGGGRLGRLGGSGGGGQSAGGTNYQDPKAEATAVLKQDVQGTQVEGRADAHQSFGAYGGTEPGNLNTAGIFGSNNTAYNANGTGGGGKINNTSNVARVFRTPNSAWSWEPNATGGGGATATTTAPASEVVTTAAEAASVTAAAAALGFDLESDPVADALEPTKKHFKKVKKVKKQQQQQNAGGGGGGGGGQGPGFGNPPAGNEPAPQEPQESMIGNQTTLAMSERMLQKTGTKGASGKKMASNGGAAAMDALRSSEGLKLANLPGNTSGQAKSDQNSGKSQAADNLAAVERYHAAAAIEFVRNYLENFTTDGGSQWNTVRNMLFIPMAILIVLPGAILTQVKTTVAAGFTGVIVEPIGPFEGIQRSIIAIFLIPATYLVVNYGIDVANSITLEVAQTYQNIFGTDMYNDAFCGHIRAFPIREPDENGGMIENKSSQMFNYFGNTPIARLEGKTVAIKYQDPCVGLYIVPEDRSNDLVPYMVNEERMAFNQTNAAMAVAWTILCALQQAFLYYLFFVGPVVAALWVYPSSQLRSAFMMWVEGTISVCMWSLFWSTTILLMAICRGVDDTGTVMFTALNFLAIGSAKAAFDFGSLVREAGSKAMEVGSQVAAAAAQAKGGGGGGHGGQQSQHPHHNTQKMGSATAAPMNSRSSTSPSSAPFESTTLDKATSEQLSHLPPNSSFGPEVTDRTGHFMTPPPGEPMGLISPLVHEPPPMSLGAQGPDYRSEATMSAMAYLTAGPAGAIDINGNSINSNPLVNTGPDVDSGGSSGPNIDINTINLSTATGGLVAAAAAGFTGFGAGHGGNAIVTDSPGGIAHGAGEGVNSALRSVEGKEGTPGLHGHQQQMLDAMNKQGATAQQQEQAAAMMKANEAANNRSLNEGAGRDQMAQQAKQQQQEMNDFLKSQGLSPSADTQKAQDAISKDYATAGSMNKESADPGALGAASLQGPGQVPNDGVKPTPPDDRRKESLDPNQSPPMTTAAGKDPAGIIQAHATDIAASVLPPSSATRDGQTPGPVGPGDVKPVAPAPMEPQASVPYLDNNPFAKKESANLPPPQENIFGTTMGTAWTGWQDSVTTQGGQQVVDAMRKSEGGIEAQAAAPLENRLTGAAAPQPMQAQAGPQATVDTSGIMGGPTPQTPQGNSVARDMLLTDEAKKFANTVVPPVDGANRSTDPAPLAGYTAPVNQSGTNAPLVGQTTDLPVSSMLPAAPIPFLAESQQALPKEQAPAAPGADTNIFGKETSTAFTSWQDSVTTQSSQQVVDSMRRGEGGIEAQARSPLENQVTGFSSTQAPVSPTGQQQPAPEMPVVQSAQYAQSAQVDPGAYSQTTGSQTNNSTLSQEILGKEATKFAESVVPPVMGANRSTDVGVPAPSMQADTTGGVYRSASPGTEWVSGSAPLPGSPAPAPITDTLPAAPAAGGTFITANQPGGSVPFDGGNASNNNSSIFGQRIQDNYQQFNQNVANVSAAEVASQTRGAVESNQSVAGSSLNSNLQETAGWQQSAPAANVDNTTQQTTNYAQYQQEQQRHASQTHDASVNPTGGTEQTVNPLYAKEMQDMADSIGSAPSVMPSDSQTGNQATGQPLMPAAGSHAPHTMAQDPQAPATPQNPQSPPPPATPPPPNQQSVLGRVLFGALPVPENQTNNAGTKDAKSEGAPPVTNKPGTPNAQTKDGQQKGGSILGNALFGRIKKDEEAFLSSADEAGRKAVRDASQQNANGPMQKPLAQNAKSAPSQDGAMQELINKLADEITDSKKEEQEEPNDKK